MDQTQQPRLYTLPVVRRRSAVNPELIQVFRDWGMQGLLRQMRDYCANQGDSALDENLSGMGWYELHDSIDQIIPDEDSTLDGEPIQSEAPCRGCRTGGERCTC